MMTPILVAASSGIVSIPWILRTLQSSIHAKDVHIRQFGRNTVLNKCLHDLGYVVESHVGGGETRRYEIRNALVSASHLLLLWDGRTLSELLFEARLKSIPTKVHAIEVTEVVNKDSSNDFDVYVGRGTPWGNPFPVGKQDGQFERSESIALFRQHFEKNVLSNPSLHRGLLGLRGLRIACHCKPLACHGDVIASYLNGIDPDSVQQNALPATMSQIEE